MSLSPSDIKLLKMNQYKELATAVGVAYYGSKTDIANRIQSKLNGKAKLVIHKGTHTAKDAALLWYHTLTHYINYPHGIGSCLSGSSVVMVRTVTRAPPRESGADLPGSVDAIVVSHGSEVVSSK